MERRVKKESTPPAGHEWPAGDADDSHTVRTALAATGGAVPHTFPAYLTVK